VHNLYTPLVLASSNLELTSIVDGGGHVRVPSKYLTVSFWRKQTSPSVFTRVSMIPELLGWSGEEHQHNPSGDIASPCVSRTVQWSWIVWVSPSGIYNSLAGINGLIVTSRISRCLAWYAYALPHGSTMGSLSAANSNQDTCTQKHNPTRILLCWTIMRGVARCMGDALSHRKTPNAISNFKSRVPCSSIARGACTSCMQWADTGTETGHAWRC
jgi:hypothetical protein